MKNNEAFSSSRWSPPPQMVRIAKERTQGILNAWSQDLRWKTVDFMTLAASCYMQGINDSIDALQQRGLQISERQGPPMLSLY